MVALQYAEKKPTIRAPKQKQKIIQEMATSPFYCDQCRIRFTDSVSYNNHMLQHKRRLQQLQAGSATGSGVAAALGPIDGLEYELLELIDRRRVEKERALYGRAFVATSVGSSGDGSGESAGTRREREGQPDVARDDEDSGAAALEALSELRAAVLAPPPNGLTAYRCLARPTNVPLNE
jgi:hypothetical protein